ncbi:cysteine desulfurase family protein [Candidatus Latescibacterota bacterium]
MDNAATTRMREEVISIMFNAMCTLYANPSSSHALGKRVRRAIEDARNTIANGLGCAASELVFTSGGTESDNLALLGHARANKVVGRHIITSAIEHSAVLNATHKLENEGFEVTYIDVTDDGVVDLDELAAAIRPDTILISIMLVNNETGVIQPIQKIVEIARAKNITVHTDAVQAIGKIQVDVETLGVDLMSLTAHKIHGPKGIGCLYVRAGTPISPLLYGGHQEKAIRPGTENTANILGFAKAFELAIGNLVEINTIISELRNALEDTITGHVPDAIINGKNAQRVSTTTNISFPTLDGTVLHRLLNRERLCVTSGSACESDSLEPSHVLTAMGIDAHLAEASVRFSLAEDTTSEDIDKTHAIVCDIVSRMRAGFSKETTHEHT